jgi:ATP-dependent Lon protease
LSEHSEREADPVGRVVLESGAERIEVPSVLPVLPVRDVVVFPGVTVPLAIGRPGSLAALERAGQGGFMIVATQRDPTTESPGVEDLHPVACVVRVMRIIDARRDGKQAIVVGVMRTRLGGRPEPGDERALLMRVEPMPDVDEDSPQRRTAWRRVVSLAEQVIDLHEDYPDEWKAFVGGIPSPGILADVVASTLPLPPEEKIVLLGETDPLQRLERIARHLEREVTIAKTQRALASRGESEEMDPEHRKRLLRRRMRDIESEIGEGDAGIREAEELREKLEEADLPPEARAQAERELQRLVALPQHAPDRHLIRTYVEWMIDLPWSRETEDKLDIAAARDVLNADHHDLEKVKDRILEFLAVRKLAPEAKSPILCFVGPPGVGKTSLGRSIARAMGRRFARASLGGVRDEAEVRGHRRTYVGAMPGRILQSLRRAGSRNPVYLLDEIDKIGADFRGDPSSALLEVLDPEQNHAFSDHYIEVPFDLSHVLFIATANTLATIPPALLDRMEVIELPGYTENDKMVIGRRHLVPKQLEAHGLDAEHIRVSDEAIEKVVRARRRSTWTLRSSATRSARRPTWPRRPSARHSRAWPSASPTRSTAATSSSSRPRRCRAARASACASPASSAT